jgi:hypothetical protein
MSAGKKKVMTIDCTPTWGGLVYHMMLVLETSKDLEARNAMRQEFTSMARAADKWNTHCKEQGK